MEFDLKIGFRSANPKLSQPSGDVLEAFLSMLRNCRERAKRPWTRTGKYGPIMVHDPY